VTIKGFGDDQGQLLLELVLVLEASIVDLLGRLVQQGNDVDGGIRIAVSGVLEVAEGRVELGELLEVLDDGEADFGEEGDGG
jgi:hypothetical protein